MNDAREYTEFELVVEDGGIIIPFEPWGHWDREVVEKLVRKHGDTLLGLFKDASFVRMQFYVDNPQWQFSDEPAKPC